MCMFASDPKEGKVLFLSLSCSLLQMGAAAFVPGCQKVWVTQLGAVLPASRRIDRPGQGGTAPSA